MNQNFILAMLKHLGYRANTILNCIDVLLALKHKQYDLILMSLGLPVVNGIDVSQQIQGKLLGNGPRIIAVTSYALPGMRQKCSEQVWMTSLSNPLVR